MSESEPTKEELHKLLTNLESQLNDLKHRVSILEAKTPFKSLGGVDPKLLTTQVTTRYKKK